jgi:EXLDI family protein
MGNFTYTYSAGESTLDVFDTLEQMRDKIPPPLYDIVAAAGGNPEVEDLDI